MDWSAASIVIAKNGTPHQTLAMIGPQRAVAGSDRMLLGSFVTPSAVIQCGIGPTTGLNSQAQLRPDRKVGTAHGRNTSAWMIGRPGNGLLSNNARTRPRMNCSRTETTVHCSVFRSAFQKFGSLASIRKLARPTKPPLNGLRIWM